MSIIINNAMQNHVFGIEHDIETTDAPLWRSIMLSLSKSDALGGQIILRHSDDQYTCLAVDRQMVDGGNLMMDDIFHYYDG